MTGFDLGIVRNTLIPSFNPKSFDDFLLTQLNTRRDSIVPAGGLKDVILGVLEIANEEGWIALLIVKAAEVRPAKTEIQELARQYGRTLAGQFPALVRIEKMREAYEEFGLSPAGFQPAQAHGALEAIVDPDNPMLNFSEWVARAARIEGRVCRIDIDGKPKGTGFLVGPKTVLTNHHVMEPAIADPGVLPKVQARFDYKELKVGDKNNPDITILGGTLFGIAKMLDSSPPTPGEKKGDPEKQDPTDEQLDYALLEVAGNPGEVPIRIAGAAAEGPRRGWIRLPEEAGGPSPFQPDFPVLIAQHPEGQPLRLAIDWNGMIRLNPSRTRVQYKTNTEPGSSGSPCFDRNWNLIALHHYGDTKYVQHPRFNQAVPIAAIRTRLIKNNLAALLGGDCD